MDRIGRQVRSKVMSSVPGKGTRLEEQLARLLRQNKLRNFKRNVPDICGKPDFVFQKQRVVIFVDSCFWHGCRWHCRMPASNQAYWQKKIERSRRRDRQVCRDLKQDGWRIIRIWEHQLADSKKSGIALWKIQSALNF